MEMPDSEIEFVRGPDGTIIRQEVQRKDCNGPCEFAPRKERLHRSFAIPT